MFKIEYITIFSSVEHLRMNHSHSEQSVVMWTLKNVWCNCKSKLIPLQLQKPFDPIVRRYHLADD